LLLILLLIIEFLDHFMLYIRSLCNWSIISVLLIEVTHTQETCGRNFYRIERALFGASILLSVQCTA